MYVYVNMYMYMYVCVYIYIYIYMCGNVPKPPSPGFLDEPGLVYPRLTTLWTKLAMRASRAHR